MFLTVYQILKSTSLTRVLASKFKPFSSITGAKPRNQVLFCSSCITLKIHVIDSCPMLDEGFSPGCSSKLPFALPQDVPIKKRVRNLRGSSRFSRAAVCLRLFFGGSLIKIDMNLFLRVMRNDTNSSLILLSNAAVAIFH